MLKRKTKFLAERIADVLNVAPLSFDPEEETLSNVTPNVFDNIDGEEVDSDEELLSKFRKQNIDLLEDVDVRYSGKKSSRKSLRDSDALSDDSELGSDVNEETDNDSIEDKNEKQESESFDEWEGDEGSEIEKTDQEYNDVEEKTTQDNKHFIHMNVNTPSSQLRKGLCVRNQMNMWEILLEIRIQLQKCLLASNKMPQKDYYKQLQKEGGSEFSKKVTETQRSLSTVLDKMLLLQKVVQKQFPETKKLGKSDEKSDMKEKYEASDEEIPSDTENEQESDNHSEEEDEVPSKKLKLQDYEKEIQDRDSKYKNYRNTVIEKWNTKTRVALIKNNANSHSVLNQIEHNLSDRTKLVKRTQLKKANYEILGDMNKGEIEDNLETNSEEFNSEIFDDADFYHQLLRELIEVKSADITDPVQLGRQWIQLQNMRSKMKRKVDTRATKGRKIRYAVHTKLVNFMAPIEENGWTDEAKNELFGSLFGKSHTSLSV